MKMIDKWFARRKQLQYYDGFGWAMTAHYLEGMSLDQIEVYLTDDSQFNRGAREAICRIGLIEKILFT